MASLPSASVLAVGATANAHDDVEPPTIELIGSGALFAPPQPFEHLTTQSLVAFPAPRPISTMQRAGGYTQG